MDWPVISIFKVQHFSDPLNEFEGWQNAKYCFKEVKRRSSLIVYDICTYSENIQYICENGSPVSSSWQYFLSKSFRWKRMGTHMMTKQVGHSEGFHMTLVYLHIRNQNTFR